VAHPALSHIRCFLLDMDGTTFLGSRLLPGAGRLLGLLQTRCLDYLFLTNNSARRREQYADKLRGLGLDILPDRIMTSGEAAAIYLSRQKQGASVYVVGTPALEEEFRQHGFALTAETPDFAVLGFDTTLTYDKLSRLCGLVRDGVAYIATHPDINCPVEGGFIPDTGAMIALVEASTGRRPDVIVGKPHRPIVDAVLARTGVPLNAMCMVGDRLYTDIALGAHGVTTVLVLTGETQPDDLTHATVIPDLVARDLDHLADLLEAPR
jgi:HAD superfamily hydrolase (TIGR01450 family)